MEQYEKYKDSGIEWIGDIPEHWDIKRVKFIIANELGVQIGPFGSSLRSEFIRNIGYKIYGQENVIKDDFTLGYKYLDEDKFNELSKYELFPGDIVITMMGTTGKCKIVPENIEKGIMDSHLIRIRVNNEKVLEKFFAVLINDSYSILNNIKYESKGSIMEGLNSSIIKSLNIPLPNINEQSSIISFIYSKTAEIDRIIANKQKLITLYVEEKQEVINQAVTKGLVPNVKLKDSGVEWLGEIPEYWEQKNLKYLARVQTGGTPKIQNAKKDYFAEGDINWYTPSDFYNDGVLEDSNRKINEFAVEDNEVEIFPENSVYLVSIGATLGKVGLSKTIASANQQINVVLFDKSVLNPFYGYYFLVSNKEMIKLEADYTTLPILNQTKTKSLTIAYPDLIEQDRIVKHIDVECGRINTILEKFNKQIDLLKEYRTTLISEVVTGKIKVPNTIKT